jgi:hypothetical protein
MLLFSAAWLILGQIIAKVYHMARLINVVQIAFIDAARRRFPSFAERSAAVS